MCGTDRLLQVCYCTVLLCTAIVYLRLYCHLLGVFYYLANLRFVVALLATLWHCLYAAWLIVFTYVGMYYDIVCLWLLYYCCTAWGYFELPTHSMFYVLLCALRVWCLLVFTRLEYLLFATRCAVLIAYFVVLLLYCMRFFELPTHSMYCVLLCALRVWCLLVFTRLEYLGCLMCCTLSCVLYVLRCCELVVRGFFAIINCVFFRPAVCGELGRFVYFILGQCFGKLCNLFWL